MNFQTITLAQSQAAGRGHPHHQDQLRDHPAGGAALCACPLVALDRGGPACGARRRGEPRDGPGLVAAGRAPGGGRDPHAAGVWPARLLRARAPGRGGRAGERRAARPLARGGPCEGEGRKAFVSKPRTRKAALCLRKRMARHGRPEELATATPRSYGAALRKLGADTKRVTERRGTNRAETSPQPIRRRKASHAAAPAHALAPDVRRRPWIGAQPLTWGPVGQGGWILGSYMACSSGDGIRSELRFVTRLLR